MDPNKFRESRQSINRMCEKIDTLIDQKSVEESKNFFDEVEGKLDVLRPQAEGEIQKRSVKNLGMKLNILATKISKLKAKKVSSRKTSGSKAAIEWNEELLAKLAVPFLEKLFANMDGDTDSKVFLGTTGKGIRPNYRIEFKDGAITAFTGSGHKPQNQLPAKGGANLSDPFPFETIKKILESK